VTRPVQILPLRTNYVHLLKISFQFLFRSVFTWRGIWPIIASALYTLPRDQKQLAAIYETKTSPRAFVSYRLTPKKHFNIGG
jgi:hypothetical protein